jgi:hypothetical protein
MSNHHIQGLFIALTICFIAVHPANSQTAKQMFSNSGIWQDYGMPLSNKNFPKIRGRLVNVNWSEIETAPNTWDWTIFDSDINQHVIDSLPIILLVYTGMNAPGWIYSNGVPKVLETDSSGNTNTYSPYYLDEDYNVYFKRMITNVRQHIQTLASSVKTKIIGIQGCYGSTGDQIAYKGAVPDNYAITSNQFDSLFKVFSIYYYTEYKDSLLKKDSALKIRLLSNPYYADSSQLYWLLKNCPGGWTKCGTFAKGAQLNFEFDKNEWLYDVLNKPSNGQYVHGRSEVIGAHLSSGWWTKNQYKQMFAIMCSCIYWGLDWPNETSDFIQNSKFDSAFAFFNKYAGQKVAGTATNALCALKDALDASDSERFPASQYGIIDRYNTARYSNIYNSFIPYGAKLEDISVLTGSEYANLSASGTNDVGWHLLPGNYERFLHQINPNATSAGFWNIDEAHNDVMYGRFGRGFDIANNKTALYFDVEDNFFRNAPLNSAYPITIEITYYDNGKGSWQLYHDAQGNSNKLAATVTCTNSGTWKKRTVTLNDAYCGNKSVYGSDFYIKNAGNENVIFSTVELSRKEQPDAGLITTALPAFDTVCINTETTPKCFVINGASLNGTQVKVNALSGYLFSTNSTGPFTSTLLLNDYGSAINETVYVKQVTSTAGDFTGSISVAGGGSKVAAVKTISVVQNTSPELNAFVSMQTCYNQKDGYIDLQPSNGKGPYKYKWTNDMQQLWTDSSEDVNGLIQANYKVVVNSSRGCSTSKTFAITQPEKIVVSAVEDSSILCKGGSTTVTVIATGGTPPYIGTGVISVKSGNRSFPVTDVNNCKGQTNLIIDNGTISAPPKPDGINGPSYASKQQANLVYSVQKPNNSYVYTWGVPADAIITSGQFTKSITVKWGLLTGNVTVKAANNCDSSNSISKKVMISNNLDDENANFISASADIFTTGPQMQVTPNPVSTVATLKINAQQAYNCSVQITDVQGKSLISQSLNIFSGANFLHFDITNFEKGVYFITLTGQNNRPKTLKILKQ